MSTKLTNLLAKLDSALERLSEALARPKDDFIRDSAIHRFEFSFELFWKLLKAYSDYKGLKVFSPRDAIRSCFKLGLLSDDEVWLAMLEDRNRTSHTYDSALADAIYAQLPVYHAAMLQVAAAVRDEFA